MKAMEAESEGKFTEYIEDGHKYLRNVANSLIRKGPSLSRCKKSSLLHWVTFITLSMLLSELLIFRFKKKFTGLTN